MSKTEGTVILGQPPQRDASRAGSGAAPPAGTHTPPAAADDDHAPAASHGVRVAIVCANCSMQMGGEAAIPFNYYRLLRVQGIDAHLVAHGRNRRELMNAFGHEPERVHLVNDNWIHRTLWRIGRSLPAEIARCTTGLTARLYAQVQQRAILRRLVREGKVNVIHQPMPVSPAEPSLIQGYGAPVVIGPMNGDIGYPPAFRTMGNLLDRAFVAASRLFARGVSWLLAGKRRAWMLLAANERTEAALALYHPQMVPARLSENGVDLSYWHAPAEPRPSTKGGPVRFVFAGRLVAWKGVDLLLRAWATLPKDLPVELEIIGDGPVRRRVERLCEKLNPARPVRFAGWMSQADVARRLPLADVLVHPSLRECGGSSVLEAMACEMPVIACGWGGPADYLDASCGILLPPIDPQQFVRDLASAIVKLAQSPALRAQLGTAARQRIVAEYGWSDKVRHMVQLYRAAVAAKRAPQALPQAPGASGAPQERQPHPPVLADAPAMAGK